MRELCHAATPLVAPADGHMMPATVWGARGLWCARKQHNRVNTHFYGQQIGDPHQKVALRQNFQLNVSGGEQEAARVIEPQKQSATALTTRAEVAQLAAAHIELYADSQQRRKFDNSANGGYL